ncbi:DUF1643 domain-containing protein [Ancylobacter sp. FA202]|uniref:DUF1643 domain-containing protein n=1 Tax=Ancylobacter sp. FA202 TaxID=1111106 RepID=UPI000367D22E|nr:DUF1643 domain-containing protein [Ancylobacter sp. FA202]
MSISYVAKGATVSACGRFRYRLWREWRLHPAPSLWSMWTDDDGSPLLDGEGDPVGWPKACIFVMLNPSTADGEQDDPTIRRCVGFARAWGYDRMEVINLFAHRATDPRALLALNDADDPVGPDNRGAFANVLFGSCPVGLVVCAWGAHGGHLGQDETALGWIGSHKRFALGLTKAGHPRHPLYVGSAADLVEFRPARGCAA